jgi:hypothetical protein
MKRPLNAQPRWTSPGLGLVPVVILATLGFAIAVSSPPAAGAGLPALPGVPPTLISIIPTSYGAFVTWSPGSSEDDGLALSLCVDEHVSTAPTESVLFYHGTVVSEPPSPSPHSPISVRGAQRKLDAEIPTTLLDPNLGTNWQSQWFEIYVYENGQPVWSQHCVGVGATAPSPPTTSVVHPTSGAHLQGTSALLVATASASNGLSLASVKFFLTRGFGYRIPICSAAAYLGYWWGHCDTTLVAKGTYTLQSYATDTSGNSAYSPGVTITVQPRCQRCRAHDHQ